MLHKVVAIRDRAVDAFLRPFMVAHIGQAKRQFRDEINRVAQDNPMHKHPDDYDLYELCEFDDNTGLFSAGKPRMIEVGKDCVERGQ